MNSDDYIFYGMILISLPFTIMMMLITLPFIVINKLIQGVLTFFK